MKLRPRYSQKYEERKRHLTPELRDKFKSLGVIVLEGELANRAYGSQEKVWAALAWLEEQREQASVRQGRSEAIKWGIAVIGAIAASIAIVRYVTGS